MRVEIVDYDKNFHENFVKAYLSAYMNHGLIYDLTIDRRRLLTSKILYCLQDYKIKVAIDADTPSKYLGFIIVRDSIIPNITFLYIKKEYHRLGIGTALLRSSNDLVINDVIIPCKTPNLNLFLKALNLKPIVRFFESLEG